MIYRRFNKKSILGAIVVLVVIVTFVFFNIDNKSEPFEIVQRMRETVVEQHELISMEETENGIMIYSVGKVNNGADNIYYVDMVKKLFRGYKWIGGGGHINRDLRYNRRDFIFSVQLLNEDQKINPTLFGILSDENIRQITVRTIDETSEAIIYDTKYGDEQLYVISLKKNAMDQRYFEFTVLYTNGEKLDFVIQGQEVNKFQKGSHIIYFFEKDIE